MYLPKKQSIFLHLPHCNEDLRKIKFIKRLVKNTITEVMKIIENMGDGTKDDQNLEYITRRIGLFGTEWPTCGSLNPMTGLKSIEAESHAWNDLPSMKNWVYHVEFICLQKCNHTEIYTYEVQWSVPTPAYPEPHVTVSILFSIAANQRYPNNFPVNVTYTFEGHHLGHNLNMTFQPKWLYDVFDMKMMMFKTFDF